MEDLVNKPTDPRFHDLTGIRFCRLVVIEYSGKVNGEHQWLCLCDCGNERSVFGGNLKKGATKSCGCMNREILSQCHTKHGNNRSDELRTSEYNSWQHLKARCYNLHCEDYKDYGARGIKVCDRWLDSFENFLADIGKKPSPKHSIDRINNDGNYEPENCKWSTQREQCRNKRNSRIITHNNQSLTVAEWAERTGIGYKTIHMRLVRGWNIQRTLTGGHA